MSKQEQICHLFDRIAPSYDRINSILSFGYDKKWRQSLAKELQNYPAPHILDIATGTADIIIAMARINAQARLWGIDLSTAMIALAKEKISRFNLDQRVKLSMADACSLPFTNNFFDIITCAFGVRNIVLLPQALAEIKRVLKPEGYVYILEFSMPSNYLFKNIYLLYFRFILPRLGALLSKDQEAYRYLNKTVEAFYSPHDFATILDKAGFSVKKISSLTFGIATLYMARAL
jgi:demethylmenaquinone methyltransferase/2-methoxy-6-polyprenyl-1,4-benzoquinol methylase